MKINILDLIDFDKIDILLEGFNKSTGFLTAILDLEGKVLSKSGWRQMCTHFHRVNPETSKKCTISDTILAGKLAAGEKYHFYKCLNGLVDVAVPIVVNGEHIANLFSGQFFFEEPDRKFFKNQAEKYGFDEEEYLKALEIVPVVSEAKVKTAMDFLLNMTQLISEMTFQKLEQTVLNEDLQNSKEYNRSLFTESPIGLLLTAINGKLIDANPAFCKIIGRTLEETLNLTYWDITPEKYSLQEAEQLKSLETKGNYGPYEKEYIHKDGYLVSVRMQGNIMERKGQKYIWSSVEDITERKKGEIRLRDEKEQKRIILELVGDPIFLKDNDHRIIFANRAFFDLFGMNEKSVIGKTLAENERKHFLEVDRNVLDTGIPDVREEELTVGHKTSTIITRKTRFIDESGNKFLVGSIHNITDRKQAEENLRASEERFRAYINQAADALFVHDFSGHFIDVNPQACKSLGYSREELLNMSVIDLELDFDLPKAQDAWSKIQPDQPFTLLGHQCRKDGSIFPVEVQFGCFDMDGKLSLIQSPSPRDGLLSIRRQRQMCIRDRIQPDQPFTLLGHQCRKDGSIFPVEVQFGCFDMDGKRCYIGLARDITERIQVEKALHESEELLRLSSELANVAAWEFDFETNSMTRSESHDKLYGLEIQDKWTFETFTNATHPDDREMSAAFIQQSVAVGGSDQYKFDFRVIYPDSSIHWLNVIGKVIKRTIDGQGILVRGFLIDITDRKQAEEKIQKFNEELEGLVVERTSELETANKELEEINDLFVGREFRIIELKEELEKLKSKFKI